MTRLFLAALAFSFAGAANAQLSQRELSEFTLNAGITVGKAKACKLDGKRIVAAAEYSFAVINRNAKSNSEGGKQTKLFSDSMSLGENYIRDNGTSHCQTVNRTLDALKAR
jgi:hypothetical protein